MANQIYGNAVFATEELEMMDAFVIVGGAVIFGILAYLVFKLCVGSPDEQVNPELARKIDNTLGMTEEGFRKSQAFHDTRMLDPEVEYGMVVDPQNLMGFSAMKPDA